MYSAASYSAAPVYRDGRSVPGRGHTTQEAPSEFKDESRARTLNGREKKKKKRNLSRCASVFHQRAIRAECTKGGRFNGAEVMIRGGFWVSLRDFFGGDIYKNLDRVFVKVFRLYVEKKIKKAALEDRYLAVLINSHQLALFLVSSCSSSTQLLFSGCFKTQWETRSRDGKAGKRSTSPRSTCYYLVSKFSVCHSALRQKKEKSVFGNLETQNQWCLDMNSETLDRDWEEKKQKQKNSTAASCPLEKYLSFHRFNINQLDSLCQTDKDPIENIWTVEAP